MVNLGVCVCVCVVVWSEIFSAGGLRFDFLLLQQTKVSLLPTTGHSLLQMCMCACVRVCVSDWVRARCVRVCVCVLYWPCLTLLSHSLPYCHEWADTKSQLTVQPPRYHHIWLHQTIGFGKCFNMVLCPVVEKYPPEKREKCFTFFWEDMPILTFYMSSVLFSF